MKKYISLIFSFFLSFTFAQEYSIGIQLEKGQNLGVKTEVFLNSEQIIDGRNIDIDSRILTTLRFVPIEISSSGFVLEAWHEFYKVEVFTQNKFVEFSSDKEGSPFSLGLRNLLNKKFKIHLDNQGKITEIEGYKKIIDAIFDEFESSQRAEMKQKFDSYLSEDNLKNSFSQLFSFIPNKKVKLKETWKNPIKTDEFSNEPLVLNFTLQKVDDQYYYIHSKGTSKTNPNVSGNRLGYKMKSNITYNYQSEIKVERKTGWIERQDVEMIASGTINFYELNLTSKIKNTILNTITNDTNLSEIDKERRLGVEPPPPNLK